MKFLLIDTLRRWRESVETWIAWHLPRGVAKWVFIRVATAATVGEHNDTDLPRLTVSEALNRWEH